MLRQADDPDRAQRLESPGPWRTERANLARVHCSSGAGPIRGSGACGATEDILLSDRESVAERREATFRVSGERSEPRTSEVRAFCPFAVAVPVSPASEVRPEWDVLLPSSSSSLYLHRGSIGSLLSPDLPDLSRSDPLGFRSFRRARISLPSDSPRPRIAF